MDTVQGREEVVTRHFEDHSICNPDNSEISAVDIGILVLRVGASPRGWFVEFAEWKKLSGADKVYEGRHPWIRACELVSADDQLNLVEQCGCLERVARVIQSDAMGDSASIDWPNLRRRGQHGQNAKAGCSQRKKESKPNPGRRR